MELPKLNPSDVFDVLEEFQNVHESILTCGATPINANPIAEQYLDVIRMEVLRHFCTHYMGMRMSDNARLEHEMNVLTRSYHRYFGYEIIEPYEPLTRFLNSWKKWMRKRRGYLRPSVMGRAGIRVQCGIVSSRTADTSAYTHFKEFLRSTEEGRKLWPVWFRKLGRMKGRISRDFKTLYLADFAATEKALKRAMGEDEESEENEAIDSAVGGPEEVSEGEDQEQVPDAVGSEEVPEEAPATETPDGTLAVEDLEAFHATEAPEEVPATALEAPETENLDDVLAVEDLEAFLATEITEEIPTTDSPVEMLAIESLEALLAAEVPEEMPATETLDEVLAIEDLEAFLATEIPEVIPTTENPVEALAIEDLEEYLAAENPEEALAIGNVEGVLDTEGLEGPLDIEGLEELLNPENLEEVPITQGLEQLSSENDPVPSAQPTTADENAVQEDTIQSPAESNHITDGAQSDLDGAIEGSQYHSQFDEYMDLRFPGHDEYQ